MAEQSDIPEEENENSFMDEVRDFADGAVMPLGDHLEELRSRLIKSIMAVAIVFIGCWFFRQAILDIITRPHKLAMASAELESTLKFRSYVEPLVAQLKACLIAAAIITAPWLIYQAWAFVAPGLYPRERKKALKMVMPSIICLLAGVGFGYFFFIPMGLRFLLRMSGAGTEPVLMIGSYLSLFFMLTLALGVAFQTPVVIFYLVRWNIVEPQVLQENRKIAILVAFVLAAFFTPPDPITQSMMALPLVMLYDLGVVAGAPSKKTFWNFSKFFGLLALGGVAILGWFFFWPVGHLEAVKGNVTVNGKAVKVGEMRRVRRGAECKIGDNGAGRLLLSGSGEDSTRVLMASGSRLQPHNSSVLSLYEGKILAIYPPEDGALRINTSIVDCRLTGGKAELTLNHDEKLDVTVAEGKVVVKKNKEEITVRAGHTKTFRLGGRRTETTDLEKEWQELFGDGNTDGQKSSDGGKSGGQSTDTGQ